MEKLPLESRGRETLARIEILAKILQEKRPTFSEDIFLQEIEDALEGEDIHWATRNSSIQDKILKSYYQVKKKFEPKMSEIIKTSNLLEREIFRKIEKGSLGICLFFNGQSSGRYLDDLYELVNTYPQMKSFLCLLLQTLSAEALYLKSTLDFEKLVEEVNNDKKLQISDEFPAGMSYPLIFVTQIMQYYCLLLLLNVSPGTLAANVKCALGYSQGIIPAVICSLSSSLEDFKDYSLKFAKYMLWIGVHSENCFLKTKEDETATPMIKISDITLEKLSENLKSFVDSDDSKNSAVISVYQNSASFIVSGEPSFLKKFQKSLILGQSKFLDVNVPFHSYVLADVETKMKEFKIALSSQHLQFPVYSTFDGSNLQLSNNLLEDLTRMQTVLPIFWELSTQHVTITKGISHLVDFGPGKFGMGWTTAKYNKIDYISAFLNEKGSQDFMGKSYLLAKMGDIEFSCIFSSNELQQTPWYIKGPIMGPLSPLDRIDIKSKMEIQFLKIFEEVLSISHIKITDNFFHLGGDSIAAQKLQAKVRGFGWDITIGILFSNPSVEELVSVLLASRFLKDKVPSTAYQQRLYFRASQVVNQTSSTFIDVPTLSTGRIFSIVNEVFRDIVSTYDILQSKFIVEHNICYIAPNETLNFYNLIGIDFEHKMDPSRKTFEKQNAIKVISDSINVNGGPLIGGVIAIHGGSIELTLIASPMAVDSHSIKILIGLFAKSIRFACKRKFIPLPSFPFLHYVNELDGKGAVFEQYWRSKDRSFSTIKPLIAKNASVEQLSQHLSVDDTFLFLKFSKMQQDEILLLSLLLGLNKDIPEKKLYAELEIDRRNVLMLDNCVGCLTSAIPIWIETSANSSYTIALHEVHKQFMDTPQDFPANCQYLSKPGPQVRIVTPSVSSQIERLEFEQSNMTLSISGHIANGVLVLNWKYKLPFSTSSITELAVFTTSQLQQVIHHFAENQAALPLKCIPHSPEVVEQILAKHQNVERIFPATDMQLGMLLQSQQLKPNQSYYVEQIVFSICGPLNVELFKSSWKKLVCTFPALRTCFDLSLSHQIVKKNVALEWKTFERNEYELNDFLVKDRLKNFVETDAPLMRFALLKRDSQVYYFVWTFHHALLDELSISYVLQAMSSFYTNRIDNINVSTDILDYVSWDNMQNRSEAKNYWCKLLKDFDPGESFIGMASFPKSDERESKVATQIKEVEDYLLYSLRQLCHKLQITIGSLIQAAWGLLLHRYSGITDIVFGCTVLNRPVEVRDAEEIVGLLINTVPVRSQTNHISLEDYLLGIHKQQVLREKYQFLPFSEIRESGALKMLSSIVVFHHSDLSSVVDMGLDISSNLVSFEERTNFPFTLTVWLAKGLKLQLDIEKCWFDHSDVFPNMVEHLYNILASFLHADMNKVDFLQEIPFITKTELDMLEKINQTDTVIISGRLEHHYIRQSLKTPNSIAVQYNEQILTYADLNSKSTDVAFHLSNKLGIKPNNCVGICMERHPGIVVAIIGILKAGCIYVSIDPKYPLRRMKHIIEDACIAYVIVDNVGHYALKNEKHINLIELSSIQEEVPTDFILPSERLFSDNICYILYTSGSTGNPKGVCIPHKAVIALIFDTKLITFNESDHIAQISSFNFDDSVFETFGALLHGCRLVIFEKNNIIDVNQFAQHLLKWKITVVNLTSALFNFLVSQKQDIFKDIQTVLIGGEQANLATVQSILERNSPNRLINVYGPTETTVNATFEILTKEVTSSRVPIGKPLSNTTAYIVDPRMQIVPIGVAGELLIGGSKVALGYLNNQKLTDEKFIPDKFGNKGGKLYRTGDLARYRQDGSIEYLGRMDRQVKLNGYRIELGEIESVLKSASFISDAAALVIEGKSELKQLVGFVVFTSNIPSDIKDSLQNYLKERLPIYMVPTEIIELLQMPLTVNMKIDNQELNSIFQLKSRQQVSNMLSPTHELQDIIATIWSKVLGVSNIDIKQNFFELGVFSLQAAHVVSMVNKTFNIQLLVRILYENPTLVSFCKAIQLHSSEKEDPLVRSENINPTASYLQKGLWYEEMRRPQHLGLYNISHAWQIRGNLIIEKLKQSFLEIIKRHEVLRSHYKIVNGEIMQIVSPLDSFEIPFNIIDSRGNMDEIIEREACKEFDLGSDKPLFRILLIVESPSISVLMITIHHIIVDGWSIGILLEELCLLYQSNVLSDLPIQYSDYVSWQQKFDHKDNISWWKNYMGDCPVLSTFPTNEMGHSVVTCEGATIDLFFEREETNKIKQLGINSGCTLGMTLLGITTLLLSKYANQDEVVIGTLNTNRLIPKTEQIIGLFATAVPLRLLVDKKQNFTKFLEQLRQNMLDCMTQTMPFPKLVECLNPPRASYHPLFQVMFVMQNGSLLEQDLQLGSEYTIEPIEIKSIQNVAKFDVVFEWKEKKGTLHGKLNFSTDLYSRLFMEQISMHFSLLLKSVMASNNKPLSSISIVSEKEYEQIVTNWNKTAIELPKKNMRLEQLFLEQVFAHPKNIAIECHEKKITFKQLHILSDNLTYYLYNELKIEPQTHIGLCMDRKPDVIIALLSVLKIGCVYVPIDPTYPTERIQYIIKDAAIHYMIVDEGGKRAIENLHLDQCTVINLNQLELQRTSKKFYLRENFDDNSACHILYTSGSTGTPKGVCIPHRAVANLIFDSKLVSFVQSDRVAQVSSFNFDLSTLEIFGALLHGACLIMNFEKHIVISPREFAAQIAASRITIMNIATALFNLLAKECPSAFKDLKCVIFGGEQANTKFVERVLANGAPSALINGYGPTEATVFSTYFDLTKSKFSSVVPIGKPLSNTQIYIVDPETQIVPIGVAGELLIGGSKVALGYLNNQKLTDEKFIPDKFGNKGGKLYRTGDLARYRQDGSIEYLGRMDRQVKINSARIELGEIESVLKSASFISDAIVLLKETAVGLKQLVGFVTPMFGTEIDIKVLQNFILTRLPTYMIPTLVPVDSFPITSNGKIDSKALFALVKSPNSAKQQDNFKHSSNSEIIHKIQKIWEKLLQCKVGIEDTFFQAGGNSFQIYELRQYLEEAFSCKLEISKFLQYTTIIQQAEWVYSEIKGFSPKHSFEERILKKKSDCNDVAIIGMAGKFPKAENLEQFWENLIKGKEGISFFEKEETMNTEIDPEILSHPNYISAKGILLSNPESFDRNYFGMEGDEAALLDPQFRLLLQTSVHALENATIDPKTYTDPIGVFIGTGESYYSEYCNLPTSFYGKDPIFRFRAKIGRIPDTAATIIAYKLGLAGPTMVIQAACATSLVAIHQACRSILSGDCEVALAGAACLDFPQKSGYLYTKGMIYSEDGHCRSFDANANGTIGGHGAGVVVLMDLQTAVQNRFPIRAVIKGSAINNDGNQKQNYFASNPGKQVQVMKSALQNASVEPDSVQFAELHGSGTPLGDSVELSAHSQVYPESLLIGSVKSNVGHLGPAAGISGLIKTVLAIELKTIPPTLHFKKFRESNISFNVPTETVSWPLVNTRRAVVNSFGQGGVNAHLVLEEAPKIIQSQQQTSRNWYLITLSAESENSLKSLCKNYKNYLRNQIRENNMLGSVAFSSHVGRSAYSLRTFVKCSNIDEAIVKLDKFNFQKSRTKRGATIFMFPGQGSSRNIGPKLYYEERVFREHVDKCISIIGNSIDIKSSILTEDRSLLGSVKIQLYLFIEQYALAQLWISWGILPEIVIGHSFGEYTAACLAEVMSLEDSLFLVKTRAELMENTEEGMMIAVEIGDLRIAKLLTSDSTISVAAINSSDQVVFSGSKKTIEELQQRLLQTGFRVHTLNTKLAFHSSLMDSILNKFQNITKTVKLKKPILKFLSCLKGDFVQNFDEDFWVEHLRQSVLFSNAVQRLTLEENAIIIECGHGGALCTLTQKQLANCTVLPFQSCLGDTLGQLWSNGININWSEFHKDEANIRLSIPPYPFEETVCSARKTIQKSALPVEVNNEKKISSIGFKTEEILDYLKSEAKLLHPSFSLMIGITTPNGNMTQSFGEHSTDVLFPLGCITRLFTLEILGIISQKTGKLKLQTPIKDLLPFQVQVPFKETHITLLHLVTSTSGLPFNPPCNPSIPLEEFTTQMLFNSFEKTDLLFVPGTQCCYSPFGVAILALILSHHLGLEYKTMLQQLILTPLELSQTTTDVINNDLAAVPHLNDGEEVPRSQFREGTVGSAGIHSSIKDMIKFARSLLDNELISSSQWIEPFLFPGNESGRCWYAGSTRGSFAWIGFDFINGVGVVVLLNSFIDAVKLCQIGERCMQIATRNNSEFLSSKVLQLWAGKNIDPDFMCRGNIFLDQLNTKNHDNNNKPRGTEQDFINTIKTGVSKLLHLSEKDVEDEVPLKEYGFDSFHAIQLTERLSKDFGKKLEFGIWFNHPTIASAASHLADSFPKQEELCLNNSVDVSQNILITGATSYLGVYILLDLCINLPNAHIYCLIRGKSPRERLVKYLQQIGISESINRVTVIPGDLLKPNMGLEQETWNLLSEKIHSIYHCASVSNWILPYDQLKQVNVEGLKKIITLATESKVTKILHYVSTVGVFQNKSSVFRESDLVPPVEETTLGFLKSKIEAEDIIKKAQQNHKLKAIIYRPEPVAWIPSSKMNTRIHRVRYFERFIKGIIQLGYFTETGFCSDWTAIDFVARAIVYISQQVNSIGKVFHISNPNPPMSFLLFANVIQQFGYPLKLVTPSELLMKLKKIGEDNVLTPVFKSLPAEIILQNDSKKDCTNTNQILKNSAIVCPHFGVELLTEFLIHLIKHDFIPDICPIDWEIPQQNSFPLIISPKHTTSLQIIFEQVTTYLPYLEKLLSKHGALLFRGFSLTTAKDFSGFVKCFNNQLRDYRDGISPRRELAPGIFTSTEYPVQYNMALHNEMTYSNSSPSKIFFFCQQAPIKGGETPIADSREILKQLNRDLVQRFKKMGIQYIINLPNHHGLGNSWQQTYSTNNREDVQKYCSSAGIDFSWKKDGTLRTKRIGCITKIHPFTKEEVWFNHSHLMHPSDLPSLTYEALNTVIDSPDDLPKNCTFADGTIIPQEDLQHIREVLQRNEVVFQWKTGDVLLLDNILCAHGRRAFDCPREILVSMI